MSLDIGFVTQSKYYTNQFNAAIFDGPLRIYFAQEQEGEALKIYFQLQECLTEKTLENKMATREKLRKLGKCIFIMLYPDAHSFQSVFAGEKGSLVHQYFGDDDLVGLQIPKSATELKTVTDYIFETLTKHIAAENNLPQAIQM